MSNPIRRHIGRGAYTGANGLAEAAASLMPDAGRNADKFTIRHVDTKLRLLIEPDGRDAYVQGSRSDATGFDTDRAAMKASDRFGLAGQGFVLEKPQL